MKPVNYEIGCPLGGSGGDDRHPHIIFEASKDVKQRCGNQPYTEWPMGRSGKRRKREATHSERPSPSMLWDEHGDLSSEHELALEEMKSLYGSDAASFKPRPSDAAEEELSSNRTRRDVRSVIKYIEMSLIIDQAMFQLRNGTSRETVVYDAVQIANIADLYFKSARTRLSITYIETWAGENKIKVDPRSDIAMTLRELTNYLTRLDNKYFINGDTVQMLTDEGRILVPLATLALDVVLVIAESRGVQTLSAQGAGDALSDEAGGEEVDDPCIDWRRLAGYFTGLSPSLQKRKDRQTASGLVSPPRSKRQGKFPEQKVESVAGGTGSQ
ncbi:unnamed protein product [Cyprideis torosa]|uniref:Uncharacterized protein n=1 Tax=Cyprideis torosa TaxID=163714 RepID=A0A7R8W8S0_9CRUS|nr:unnamed protein product [Cyprideis torosa]CAG0884087.1 unnamed protein product [Cyprideis torosa]